MSRSGATHAVWLVLLAWMFSGPARADMRLTSGTTDANTPTVAVGADGNARVVWAAAVGGISQVFWQSVNARGQVLAGPVQVTTGTTGCSLPQVSAAADSRSYLVWVQGAGSSSRIYWARLGLTGQIEAGPVLINTGNAEYARPEIVAAADGTSHIAFEWRGPGLFYLRYVVMSSAGVVLQSLIPGNTDILGVYKYPSISRDPDGYTYIAWYDYNNFSSGIYLAIYDPTGALAYRSRIMNGSDISRPALCTPRFNWLWLLYQQPSSGVDRIWSWLGSNSATIVSPAPGPTRSPRVAGADGQDVLAVWEDQSAGNARIMAGRWTIDGTYVDDAIVISESTAQATAPDIATDGEGQYFMVWRDTRDGIANVYMDTIQPAPSLWPICTDTPCFRFRVDADDPSRIARLRLTGDLETTDKADVTVPVVDGFAVFGRQEIDDAVNFLNAIDRIDILSGDASPAILGHIGFKYTDTNFDDGISKDAVLYLHNGPGFPMDGANPDNLFRQLGWDYFDEGESPVSMLVPPGAAIGRAGGGDQKPVLFVHGLNGFYPYWSETDGSNDTPGSLDDMTCDPWEFYYPYDQSIDVSEQMLRAAASRLMSGAIPDVPAYDQHGLTIAAHSMGGLVVRQALERPEFAPLVSRLLMIAPPSHGSYLAWRTAYDRYGFDSLLAMLRDSWAVYDPDAPAYLDLAIGSDWMNMHADAPFPASGYLEPAEACLVVAGTRAIYNIYHSEMEQHDDGVVSVSSASLTQHGIPLALVNEDHIHIHKSNVIRSILLWLTDTSRDAAWVRGLGGVLCVQESPGSSQCESVSDNVLDKHLGLISVRLPNAPRNADQFSIDSTDNWTLRLTTNGDLNFPNIVARRELRRGNASTNGYFSRCRRGWFDPIEVAHWLAPGDYQLVFDDDRGEMRSINSLHVDHMGTATGSIMFTLGSTVASNVDSYWRLAPFFDKSAVSYQQVVDDRMNAVVFSLSAGNIDSAALPHEMVLVDPQGRVIDETVAEADPLVTMYTESDQGPIRYVVATPTPGLWTVRHSDLLTRPQVIAGAYSGIIADLAIESRIYTVGDSIACTVSMTSQEPLSAVTVGVAVALCESTEAPAVPLGNVALQETAPGTWTGAWPNAVAGRHELQLTFSGTTGDGQVISRGSVQSMLVDPAAHGATSVPFDRDDPVMPPLSGTHLAVNPNPFNATTEVAFELADSEHLRLTIYSVDGRRVVELANGEYAAGGHVIPWSGMDEQGRASASGVYVVVLTTASGQVASKVALLK